MKRRTFLGLLAAIPAGFRAAVNVAVASDPVWEMWCIDELRRIPRSSLHVSAPLTEISLHHMHNANSWAVPHGFPGI